MKKKETDLQCINKNPFFFIVDLFLLFFFLSFSIFLFCNNTYWMVSSYSTQPFAMTAENSRSIIALPQQETHVVERIPQTTTTQSSWSQLVHAEIMGTKKTIKKIPSHPVNHAKLMS